MKKGFTIVELLMVIAILAVLLGIVTTAAMASIRQSRGRQTQAMKQTLQNGISAYKVRKDKWPDKLEAWAKQSNKDRLGYLSNGDYDNVMHQLLRASSGKSAKSRVMDPVGLSVMVTTGLDGRLNCLDYRSVTTKSNKHAKRMEPDEMTVVYPESSTGKAYRFVIEYNTESDEVTVMTQKEFNDMIDQLSDAERSRKNLRHWEGKDVWR